MPNRGLRGATTVNSNTRDAIIDGTTELLQQLIDANGIKEDDVAFALFTTSPDLNAEFPAVAARQMGWNTTALMCGHEMNVPGSLQKCIRILISWNSEKKQSEINHIYLRGAKVLRTDLENSKNSRGAK